MYPVTDLYKDAIQKDNREFTCDIRIEHSQGILNLTDEDLSMGSLTYTEATQSGDEYTIGSTVASDISFTIFKKPEYEDIQFMGATVFVTIGLYVMEGIDAHFIQPSQPSKMQGFDDKWEYVPLGRFNIDDVNIKSNTIGLKAMDNMINLDKPYLLSKLSYPATLQQIYVNLCNVADVLVGTLNFPNMNYTVTNKPSNDLTLRDVLGYVAELSGTFAKCTRTGSVELRWYEPTDLELSPEYRYDFTPSDDVIQITGILATVKGEEEEEVEDVTYISGSEGYTIDLTENALLQGDYETVLPNIYNNVKDTIFTPYSSNSKGNPAIQAGDIIKQIDKNGKEYITLITKSVYKYKGKSTLEGKGLSQISKGYKGSTNRRLAEIKYKVDVEIGDKLTDLEQAMLNATELITGQMGGHVLKREGELLIMDNPDPELAVKVWRWNLGGLGYSNTGVDGIYEIAMTMDGSINAKFITTGSLSANIVQAGLLQSTDGSTWINLDNGTFNLKDKIKFVNNKFNLSLEGTDANNEVDSKINSAKSEIKITTDEISGRVSNVQTDIGGLGTRMSSAESKITPTAITSTVNSSISNGSIDVPTKTEVSQIKQTADSVSLNFTELKNLSTGHELSGGSTTINRNGIRVDHTGLGGQYSEMRADGFVRKWRYGEAKYLNDIYTYTNLATDNDRDSPNPLTIPLPDRFKNRTDLVAILVPKDWRASRLINVRSDNTISYGLDYIDLWTSVSITTGSTPTVNITAYLEIRLEDEEDIEYRVKFRDVGFDLIIFGY